MYGVIGTQKGPERLTRPGPLNVERRMPNAERKTSNAERRTSNDERRTTNVGYWNVYLKLIIITYRSALLGLLSDAVVWNVRLINSGPDAPATVASR